MKKKGTMDWLKPRQTFLNAETGTVSSGHLRKRMLSDFSICEILLTCDPVPHKAVEEHFAQIEEYAQKIIFPFRPSTVNDFMELFVDPPLKEMFPSVFNYARTQAGKKEARQGKNFLDFNEHTLVSDDDDDDDEMESDSDSLSFSDSEDEEGGNDKEDEDDDDDDDDVINRDNDFDKYCVKIGYLSSLNQVCKQVEAAAVNKRSEEVVVKLELLDDIFKMDDTSKELKSELGEKLESDSLDDIEEWSLQFITKMFDFVKAQTSDTSRHYTQFLGIKTN